MNTFFPKYKKSHSISVREQVNFLNKLTQTRPVRFIYSPKQQQLKQFMDVIKVKCALITHTQSSLISNEHHRMNASTISLSIHIIT